MLIKDLKDIIKSIDKFNEKYGNTDFDELTLLSYCKYIDIQKDEHDKEYIAVYGCNDECECEIEYIYDKDGKEIG